ncbi:MULTISPECIES: amino acid ABC transporter permease [Brevibacillus]|uniref:amino acid ABC transporter permease n=1 Tax=Brevibacillus TaxID=55080 RepID=UPI000EBAED12|nr:MULTISPECIES: amino acid ABC transporter permease [Brevibacillus]MBU8714490.1 amino acid ABC transporter permease [Brevibacillus parabrevis]MDR4998669.1 amino acid ABC transporter permease [Brevibacillus parabrevis]MED2254802.1 amino acid ABC transporter permease [Brevibacillus parabrevis]RNB95610.1 amino acid ABC transporter permease [Brevibacillus parabrevis]UED67699.1 amino acid ABC transporter permease [Brevibacillus sp. HD3.3A]
MFLSNFFDNPERLNRWIDIAQSSFLPLLKGALLYSLTLAIVSFFFGLILAVLTALARLSGIKPLVGLARFYVSLIRGTPLLVQLFIIFFGLPSVGIMIDPFPSAVIGFSLSVGAYSSEVVRAAILSIHKGQWEAAYSLGMTYWQALRRVVLPQAARVSVPPLSNSFISLVKDTSLAAAILVPEMFRKAQEIVASTYEPLLVYSEAALIYWMICFVLSFIQDRIENKLDRYV